MAVLNQDKLEKDLRKYLKIFAETYCKEASKELTKTAKNAIQQFYKDYTPNIYDRTEDLKNNSYKPYYHYNGRTFYGGVRITSENMSPYQPSSQSPTDPFEVASFAWNGWHGHPIRCIYTTPPIQIVKEKKEDKKFLEELKSKATKEAQKQNYEILLRNN